MIRTSSNILSNPSAEAAIGSNALLDQARALAGQNHIDEAVVYIDMACKATKSCHEKTECGILAYNIGKKDLALSCFRQAQAINPDEPHVLGNIAQILLDKKIIDINTIKICARAVVLDPSFPNHQTRLARILQNIEFTAPDDDATRAIAICLKSGNVYCDHLIAAWNSIIDCEPRFSALKELFQAKTEKDFESSFDPETLRPVLNDPFLLAGMGWLRPYGIRNEFFFTRARRCLLNMAVGGPDSQMALRPLHDFIATLACMTFFTEYIFRQSMEEMLLLDRLRGLIEKTAPDKMLWRALVSLYASYRPLAKEPHDFQDKIVAMNGGGEYWDHMIKETVLDAREEAKIRPEIAALSAPTDEISRQVAAQYEESPYPRWRSFNRPQLNPLCYELSNGLDVLIAGCGTGQEALGNAHFLPNAKITAIDLSRASLAYAARSAKEMGYKNVSFLQADILDFQKEGISFDMIISSGVIHHMKDPVQGLRALVSMLNPGGRIHLGLYSRMARAPIYEARRYIEENRMSSSTEHMKSFRSYVLDTPEDQERRKLTCWWDFFSLSSLRDMFFHVQEHSYTLPELQAIFEAEGLASCGMTMLPAEAAARYKERWPEDSAMADLHRWHEIECEKPDTFVAMYFIRLCRKAEQGMDTAARRIFEAQII